MASAAPLYGLVSTLRTMNSRKPPCQMVGEYDRSKSTPGICLKPCTYIRDLRVPSRLYVAECLAQRDHSVELVDRLLVDEGPVFDESVVLLDACILPELLFILREVLDLVRLERLGVPNVDVFINGLHTHQQPLAHGGGVFGR